MHQLFEVLLVNVYTNKRSFSKLSSRFDDWIRDILVRRPNTPLIICGDFNSKTNPVPYLHNMNDKTQVTYKRIVKREERSFITDWILCS